MQYRRIQPEAGGSTVTIEYAIELPFWILLLICIVMDCWKRIIPDAITLPGTLYFIIVHAITGTLAWWQPLVGALGLGAIALLLAIISRGKLGGGDIKLFAMVGAYLGWSAGIWALLFTFPIAALIACPVLLMKKIAPPTIKLPEELPLAPFIATSTILLIALLQKVAETHV